MNSPIWQDSLAEELAFWRRWLTEDFFREARAPRLDPSAPFPHWLRDLVSTAEGPVRVLDVGSGPVSTIGTVWPERTVDLALVDPLADGYNALLHECGLGDRATIRKGEGETLDTLFPQDYFHLVHSANALDHAHDPLRCLRNMLHVCMPGGHTVFVSVENEGERQGYDGLHQWNFELRENRLRLWNRERSLMVHEHLDSVGEFSAQQIDHGNGLPMFLVTVRKRS